MKMLIPKSVRTLFMGHACVSVFLPIFVSLVLGIDHLHFAKFSNLESRSFIFNFRCFGEVGLSPESCGLERYRVLFLLFFMLSSHHVIFVVKVSIQTLFCKQFPVRLKPCPFVSALIGIPVMRSLLEECFFYSIFSSVLIASSFQAIMSKLQFIISVVRVMMVSIRLYALSSDSVTFHILW